MLKFTKLRRKKLSLLNTVSHDTFKAARRRLGWSYDQTADFLWVTSKTIRNWESGRARIPYSAFKLLRISSGYEVNIAGWDGWEFGFDGSLVSPAGRYFFAKDLEYLSFVFAQARLWRGAAHRQTGTQGPRLPVDAPPLVKRGERK